MENDSLKNSLRSRSNKPNLAFPWPKFAGRWRIAESTFFNWKKRFSGLEVSEWRRLRQPEEGEGKLKQLVAHLSLGNLVAARRGSTKALKPAQR